ncbi:cupin domain-containing protein [Halomarina pelagica]|uniref:cupin domain-containing protein n=1 Tax=Halomarina pelagica TaxID=2961599 RepID=UPI0020C36DCF|nr:cupin domain-containing protein [Halomarina sp. BND7]
MDVVHSGDRAAPEVLDGVELAQLAAGERMSVQHFDIGPGAVVGDHSHEHEQAGYLFSGELVFTVEGEEYPVEAGDSYVIPGEAVHAAENRGDEPAVGVEIFSPPRPVPPWADD